MQSCSLQNHNVASLNQVVGCCSVNKLFKSSIQTSQITLFNFVDHAYKVVYGLSVIRSKVLDEIANPRVTAMIVLNHT